jgi:serpin B
MVVVIASCRPISKDGSVDIVEVDARELLVLGGELDQAELLAPGREQDQTVRAVADGANDFAFRLSASLIKNLGNENFVCSPYSVWLPLAALVNATNSQNKAALLTALGASGISEEDINRAASRMLYDLTNVWYKDNGYEYNNPLKIVNAIFVGNNVNLRNDFVQTFMNFYRGSSINVDFSSSAAVDAVNRWASENTNGLITNLVQEFDPETVAAIANAIYFSDRWQREFKPEETKEGVFHAAAGDRTAFYMLREGDRQRYYEDSRVQAMPLFMNDGGLYIILPKTGSAVELLSSMSNEYFNEIQTGATWETGKLLLPRFSIENDTQSLKAALEGLGVPLFNEDTAPLTAGLVQGNESVWLSDAMQKAVIHVDEKGTTAAAVTDLAAYALGIRPQPTRLFEMICDRPFVFILYDYIYDGGNQILFTGIVNEPK